MVVRLAWRNLWRHRRRTLITASALAVAVALCMALLAFNDGMYAKMFDVMVTQRSGHIRVERPGYTAAPLLHHTLGDAAATLRTIDTTPGVSAASPRLEAAGLIGSDTVALGAQLVGLDPARDPRVSHNDARVVEGRYLDADPRKQIVLGAGLAKALQLRPGDRAALLTRGADGSIGNDLFEVVGLFATGDAQLDRAGAWLHLADLQELVALPDQVHRITVLSRDANRDAVEALATRIADALPRAEVRPWWVADPTTERLLQTQTAGQVVLLGIVFTMAGFGIANTMVMSVFERTREIGLQKALGTRPASLVGQIVCESVLLAGIAGVAGLLLGGLLDAYLVVYGVDLSADGEGLRFQGIQLDPVFKGEVRPRSVASVWVALLGLGVAASFFPALRAARLDPVDAMRVED